MEIRNKARFWTGAIMGLFELLALGIYGLTILNWTWLTEKVVLMAVTISAIVLYNALAIILILNGSGKE